jgi:hypothetical protein
MIEDDGRNMLGAIQQVRRLMVDVSKMLLEADAMMGQAGWEQRAGSTAMAGMAYSIHSPRNWIPHQIFRFYRHPDVKLAIPCVSVLLESADTKPKLLEPHVSGLLMQYETEEAMPEGSALYRTATWHLYVPNRMDDGSLMSIEPRAIWPKDSDAKKMTSFAVPLVSVRNRDALKEVVISPLLRIVSDSSAFAGEIAIS